MDPPVIESLYIRLHGPLQSWAGPAVTGNIVRTERHPTRSGLTGLVAGALGCPRGDTPKWLNEIEFWVRQDRKPIIVDDFHTINPRPEAELFRRRLLLAQGSKARGKKALTFTPDAQGGTSIVNRTYLADGEFLVRITCADHTDALEEALASPEFVTYLGRKAFSATFPFYLGRGSADAFLQIPALPHTLPREESQHLPEKRVVQCVKHSAFTTHGGERQQIELPLARSADERLGRISELLHIRREAA